MISGRIRDFIKERLAVSADLDEEISLADGRSGAEVYSIKVTSRRNRLSGNYIVKICNATEKRDENEAEKARQFCDYSSAFSNHLVKVVASKQIDTSDVIIYSQANESRMHSTAFSALDGERRARYVKQVSYDLLSVLNESAQINGTVEDFFQNLLAKQLGKSGRFTERMEHLLDRPQAECIAINGTIYPNPLYFMKHLSAWSTYLHNLHNLHIFQGASHGDLHGFNLLAADTTYAIIDFDSANINSYLLFDNAYFEFSTFYDNFRDNDTKRWSDMLERLVSPSPFEQVKPCEYYMEYMVRNAVCEGIKKWVEDAKLERQRDDIETQFLMARIAAGINFFCKKTCADQRRQIKVLLFISHCFRLIFKNVGYSYDENDISSLSLTSGLVDTENFWEDFLRFTNYVPVLITDDLYASENTQELKSLCGVHWSLVVDIGEEQKELVIYRTFLENVKGESVKRINIISGENVETFTCTLNILSVRKSVNSSYSKLWRDYGEQVLKNMKRLLSDTPQVPLVLIFDCSRSSQRFFNQMLNQLCGIPLPRRSRVVSLRMQFPADFKEDIEELEMEYDWRFIEYSGVTLLHVAQSCKLYLNEACRAERSANLPSLDGVYTFSEEDMVSFAPSIELLYAGCEDTVGIEQKQVGFDLSGGGDSLGEAFYKGNEATWNDIAKGRDRPLLEDKKYQELQKRLLRLMEETSPRVQKMRIVHGAGTGGTTLTKRILWDLKDSVPCVWLKKYSRMTADMLLEVYKKTGKRVLVAVEQGSTVIADDELSTLCQQVDAENGKLLLLLITRSNRGTYSIQGRNQGASDIIARLTDTMPVRIAVDFKETFSTYAARKENCTQRIKLLNDITDKDNYKDQRSPFFYGFYTFQEEYNLLDRLNHTVFSCNTHEKTLLNSLALVTVFSQNVCVAFSELPEILGMENNNGTMNIYVMLEELPTALSKLIVIRNNGFRLCHRIIAEKVLLILHDPEKQCNELKCVIYKATKDYIQVLCKLYKDGEYVDGVLKELIIDRAYIDADAQRTKFSPLVEAIPLWTDRKNLFELLIQSFPENPHYYNHLARLLVFEDKTNRILPQYEEAVKQAKMAIDVAIETNSSVLVHRTTLGYIYGQWIIYDIKSEINNKRFGRLALSYADLIDSFRERYNLACAEFEDFRDSAEAYDSFSYFPQITMECAIILQLIKFDHNRNLGQLMEQEPAFREWYDEHFSIAAELTLKMGEWRENNLPLWEEAKQRLLSIAENSMGGLGEQLNKLLQSDTAVDMRRRRALAYTIFTVNGCSWSKVEQEMIELAEKCFKKNFMGSDGSHKSSDVETWFELYRRTRYFQASEAQSIIVDYMEDGYKKEYMLFLNAFTLYEAGRAGTSIAAVNERVNEAHRLARLHGINTAREHDLFVGDNAVGCPIVRVMDVPRDSSGELIGLKIFTGTVTEVEPTHGKILLDELKLEVTFIPNPATVNMDPERTFTRKDVPHRVSLNLAFSYSGLRGWNVRKYYGLNAPH